MTRISLTQHNMIASTPSAGRHGGERALGIFQQLGLVEQLHGGLLYMTDIELMIGQSFTEAERKRAQGLQTRLCHHPKQRWTSRSDRPPEIEIKKEIDIEIEKERELETEQAPARSYGRYNNVFLSDTELDELKAELPTNGEYYIDRLSTHMASERNEIPQSCSHDTSGRRRIMEARNRRKKAYPITPLRRAESL